MAARESTANDGVSPTETVSLLHSGPERAVRFQRAEQWRRAAGNYASVSGSGSGSGSGPGRQLGLRVRLRIDQLAASRRWVKKRVAFKLTTGQVINSQLFQFLFTYISVLFLELFKSSHGM